MFKSCIVMAVALTGLWLAPVESAFAQKGALNPPEISCYSATKSAITLEVCAGASGAPAGFSVQWMTLAEYEANGETWYLSDDARLCKASFSGNANGTRYNLGPNECTTVQLGDNLFDDPGASSNCANKPLECGTTYVFRAFAHANSKLKRSNFTANLLCSTLPCDDDCFALSQGYWKTHAAASNGDDNKPGTSDDVLDFHGWPAEIVTNGGLLLGNNFYTLEELYFIWWTPSKGNQLLNLAHQLMAVEFSLVDFGPNPDDAIISLAVATAHDLIGDLFIPPTDGSTDSLSDDLGLTDALDSYIQFNHCGDDDM